MGAFDHVSFSHTLGWGFEDSALVGWVCFAFRVQAVMIAAPIAGLILLVRTLCWLSPLRAARGKGEAWRGRSSGGPGDELAAAAASLLA